MNNDTQITQQPAPADIDMTAIIAEWKLSKAYVYNYTINFRDLDNLVDAVPLKYDPDAPFIGDTTLAGLVRSIPRNSLEQLPVLSVSINGTKNSIQALVATYVLKKFAFNEDTFGKGLLSTLQIGGEQAITHGYAPFMVATGTMYEDFGTTLRLLHFSDAAIEPGVTDGNEIGYSYVTANLTKSRVQKILKKALANPDTAWNTEALQRVLDTAPTAKNYAIYESDPRRNAAGDEAGPTYEFVTRHETGPGGTVITFCPLVEDVPLRTLTSKSKFGYPRVQLLVIDPAALSPFGVSRVRLASPNQNLLNIYLQSIAAMLLLNSKPPILKRGRFIKPVQLKQSQVWESLDTNANATLVTIDNGSLDKFVEMAQYFSAQIQNIMSRPVGTINGGNNSNGYSKTGPGVKMQQNEQDNSTNQITKILENFLRQYGLVALDTIFSEQTGEDKIIVDDETKNAINELVPGTIGDDNKILMNWQRFYEAVEVWSVEVEVSLSKDEIDDKKRGDLQDMLVVLGQNAEALGPEAQQKVKEITDMLMQDNAPLVKPISLAPNPTAPMVPVAPAPVQNNLQ